MPVSGSIRPYYTISLFYLGLGSFIHCVHRIRLFKRANSASRVFPWNFDVNAMYVCPTSGKEFSAQFCICGKVGPCFKRAPLKNSSMMGYVSTRIGIGSIPLEPLTTAIGPESYQATQPARMKENHLLDSLQKFYLSEKIIPEAAMKVMSNTASAIKIRAKLFRS